MFYSCLAFIISEFRGKVEGAEGQLVQKLYHPWQISALHFAEQQLLVALTDGTIQLWNLF